MCRFGAQAAVRQGERASPRWWDRAPAGGRAPVCSAGVTTARPEKSKKLSRTDPQWPGTLSQSPPGRPRSRGFPGVPDALLALHDGISVPVRGGTVTRWRAGSSRCSALPSLLLRTPRSGRPIADCRVPMVFGATGIVRGRVSPNHPNRMIPVYGGGVQGDRSWLSAAFSSEDGERVDRDSACRREPQRAATNRKVRLALQAPRRLPERSGSATISGMPRRGRATRAPRPADRRVDRRTGVADVAGVHGEEVMVVHPADAHFLPVTAASWLRSPGSFGAGDKFVDARSGTRTRYDQVTAWSCRRNSRRQSAGLGGRGRGGPPWRPRRRRRRRA